MKNKSLTISQKILADVDDGLNNLKRHIQKKYGLDGTKAIDYLNNSIALLYAFYSRKSIKKCFSCDETSNLILNDKEEDEKTYLCKKCDNAEKKKLAERIGHTKKMFKKL